MNFKNILKKIFLHFKEVWLCIYNRFFHIYIQVKIALELLIHIFKYYQNLIAWDIAEKLEDSSLMRELKSFVIAFVVAFFFYYFIVIELSILLFGYSLLCY